MFYSLLKRAALLSGLVATGASSAMAADAVLNGGFESALNGFTWTSPGATSGGVPVIDATDPHSGAQLAYMDNPMTGTAQMVNKYQEDLFIAGKTLHAKAWIKVTTNPGSLVQTWLAVNQKTSATAGPNTVGPAHTGAQATWKRIDVSYLVTNDARADLSSPITPGDNNYFLGLRIVSFSAAGSTGTSRTFVDDLSLEEYTINPQDRLINPGFELGLSGWSTFNVTTAEVTETAPFAGSTALVMTYDPGIGGFAYQVYNGPDWFTGSDLYMSAWYKASFGTGTGFVGIGKDAIVNGTLGNDFGPVVPYVYGDQPVWTRISGNFISAAGPSATPGDGLSLRLYADTTGITSGLSTVYWDDVQFWPSSVPVELSGFGIE